MDTFFDNLKKINKRQGIKVNENLINSKSNEEEDRYRKFSFILTKQLELFLKNYFIHAFQIGNVPFNRNSAFCHNSVLDLVILPKKSLFPFIL